jgi:heme-degrading monooxygenase HmoA
VAAIAARAVEEVGARLEPEQRDDTLGLPLSGLGIGDLRVRPEVQLVEELVPRALGVMLGVADSSESRGGGVMEIDDSYVWITTRRLKPGAREEFSRTWKPKEFPAGMLRAYECYSDDGAEVVGIAIWDSRESWDRFRRSEAEQERRRAMAPYILDERSGFYTGRELKIPQR